MRRPKLTDLEKGEIRKLRSGGMTLSALARKYGVSVTTIKRTVDPELYARHLVSASQYNSENEKRIREMRSRNLRRFGFSLHRVKDEDLIEVLSRKENITQYIRELIASDIQNQEQDSASPAYPDNL